MKIKHLTLFILAAISLLACKKAPEIPVATVQLSNEVVTSYTRTVTITSNYSYPTELKEVTIIVSKNNDLSDAVTQKATTTASTIEVVVTGLERVTTYYYCFEYKSGSVSSKSPLKSFKTLDYSKPTVTTSEVTEITATTAKCGGSVVDDGDIDITARGVCWSTSQNPTISNCHTTDGSGLGNFTSSLTNLEIETKYYVRAYATNSKGTNYGEEKSFITKDGNIILTTSEVTEVTAISAKCGGIVVDDGGLNVIARGVCWSTSSNPEITDYHTTDGSGLGEFISSLTNLEIKTKYYVRAYATNSKGTNYGEEKSFAIPIGSVPGVFSVSSTKQVYFSQGNLQYQASTNTWRFAEHQYDYVGDANSNISSSYSGWIDLFGWGTSGQNTGAVAYQPYSTSTDYSDYYPGGSYTNDLTYGNKADWGYNAIYNGGNTIMQWRTLIGGENGEWNYLWNTRANASSRRGFACINGINGIVLLPDNWIQPSGVSFIPNTLYFNMNTYSVSVWMIMENNGAVFLPAAGARSGTSVSSVGSYGNYWSSSCDDSIRSSNLSFNSGSVKTSSNGTRYHGRSVRLVRDL